MVPAGRHVTRVREVRVLVWVAAHCLRGRTLGRGWQRRAPSDLLLHPLNLRQHRVQVLDVVDGRRQNLHPADLLLSRCTGNGDPQLLEALIDLFHPIPFSCVPPDRLRRIPGRFHRGVTLLSLEGNLSLRHHCNFQGGRLRIVLKVDLAL